MIELGSRILHEDNHLIIFNKPSGLLVQGDHTGDTPLLDLCKQFLKEKYKKPGNVFAGMVHRLDRPTSGCIVMAKTSKALSRMTRLFADRKVEKFYWALTDFQKIPAKGHLTHYIEKVGTKNKVICHTLPKLNSKKAVLDYEVIVRLGSTLLLHINLKTGRKHQIRAQLKSMQCTIIGDLKYGAPFPNQDKSICLHCRSLSFIHPVSKEPIKVECLPPDIPEWSDVNHWAKENSCKIIHS